MQRTLFSGKSRRLAEKLRNLSCGSCREKSVGCDSLPTLRWKSDEVVSALLDQAIDRVLVTIMILSTLICLSSNDRLPSPGISTRSAIGVPLSTNLATVFQELHLLGRIEMCRADHGGVDTEILAGFLRAVL